METKNAKVCYEELKNKSMSIEQFRTYLGNVVNIKDFASNFLNVVNEDIKGGHKNLDTIIETFKELLRNNELDENNKSKIIDALTEIARKVQENQWKPGQIMSLITIIGTIILVILGINNKKQ